MPVPKKKAALKATASTASTKTASTKTASTKTASTKTASTKTASTKTAPQNSDSVDAWVAACTHAERATLIAVRARLRTLRPDVEEGVKWNAPSYRTKDWFATFFARPDRPLQLVLHAGARAKGKAVVVADPLGLLQRKDAERAVIALAGVDVDAVAALARAWLDAVDPR